MAMRKDSSKVITNPSKEPVPSKKGKERQGQQIKKQLPPDFADRVLELEIELERDDFTIDTLNCLLSLYSMAVEYYESIHSEKYVYYAEKIQNTLVKPEVMKVMSSVGSPEKNTKSSHHSDNAQPLTSSELKKLKEKGLEKKKKQRAMIYHLHMANQEEGNRIGKIIDDLNKSQEHSEISLKRDMMIQEETLQKRLAARKKLGRATSQPLLMKNKPSTNSTHSIKGLDTAKIGIQIHSQDDSPLETSSMSPDFKDVKNKGKFKLDLSNKNTFDPKFSEELSARLHDPNLLNKKKKNLVIETNSNNDDQIETVDEEIDVEAVESNIKEIWEDCEAEIEKIHQDRERIVEEFLEKAANEKFEKLATVKSKYDGQIKEMEAKAAKMNNGLMGKVIENMKKEKDMEVKKISEELDIKKRSDLDRLKRDLDEKKNQHLKDAHIDKATQKMRQSLSRKSSRFNSKTTTPTFKGKLNIFNADKNNNEVKKVMQFMGENNVSGTAAEGSSGQEPVNARMESEEEEIKANGEPREFVFKQSASQPLFVKRISSGYIGQLRGTKSKPQILTEVSKDTEAKEEETGTCN